MARARCISVASWAKEPDPLGRRLLNVLHRLCHPLPLFEGEANVRAKITGDSATLHRELVHRMNCRKPWPAELRWASVRQTIETCDDVPFHLNVCIKMYQFTICSVVRVHRKSEAKGWFDHQPSKKQSGNCFRENCYRYHNGYNSNGYNSY